MLCVTLTGIGKEVIVKSKGMIHICNHHETACYHVCGNSCSGSGRVEHTQVNNYRPIAIVTIMSKIFELILFEYREKYLQTTNQLGFKKQYSYVYVYIYMLWRMSYTIIVI